MEWEVKGAIIKALMERGYAGKCSKCSRWCVYVDVERKLCMNCSMGEVIGNE